MKRGKNTELKDDARKIFLDLYGTEVAKQLDNFENPREYPKDFLEECTYFLSKLIGEKSAKERLLPLYKKYVQKRH
jgi:hypothetical protein